MSIPPAELDRAAAARTDPARLQQLWSDPAAQVVAIARGAVGVRPDPTGPDGIALRTTDIGETDPAARIFLGLDPQQRPWWCVRLPHEQGEGLRWPGLREVGPGLTSLEWEVLSTAVALDSWHTRHGFCPACGGRTEPQQAGWTRRCSADGSEHYPRTDPAIIVLVIDAQDRALLARQRRWPKTWRSTLAGFVEPGEPAETAVRREVAEEVGLALDGVRYLSSQPWPFPGSLMLGFHADAASTGIEVDGDEIAQAEWYTREHLADAAASGDIALPPSISIARLLIERWYGAPLPGGWLRG